MSSSTQPKRRPLASPPAQASRRGVIHHAPTPVYKRGNMIGASFGSALEALWANRLRSLLTALGIFIGVVQLQFRILVCANADGKNISVGRDGWATSAT